MQHTSLLFYALDGKVASWSLYLYFLVNLKHIDIVTQREIQRIIQKEGIRIKSWNKIEFKPLFWPILSIKNLIHYRFLGFVWCILSFLQKLLLRLKLILIKLNPTEAVYLLKIDCRNWKFWVFHFFLSLSINCNIHRNIYYLFHAFWFIFLYVICTLFHIYIYIDQDSRLLLKVNITSEQQ